VSAETPTPDPALPPFTVGFFLIHCVLPMVIGGLVYLTWRSDSLLMFGWARAIGLEGAVEMLRSQFGHHRASVPEWILFSVPDGAWVYSSTAFFGRLWTDGPWPVRFGWIGIGSALAIGGELGQIVGLVPGTFDIVDIVLYIVAAAVAFGFATGWRRLFSRETS
jgi:hypothetical protein